MQYPLPIRLLQTLSQKVPRPALTSSLLLLAALTILFVLSGALFPSATLPGYDSRLQITGQFLVFTLLPPYLLACLVVQTRATPGIVSALEPLLDEPEREALERLDRVRYWQLGVVLGIVYAALANIPWGILSFRPDSPVFVFSLVSVFAQAFTWGLVGLMLAWAEHNAFLLYRVGHRVHIDLFNLDALNPFGQSALRSMLIVVGALAITPLQAIDQAFRWVNYSTALMVGVPAMLVLLLVPIWSVHRQIRCRKREELQRVDAEIASASRELDDAALTRLNALLERRGHLSHLREWPLDFSLFSRIVFYVLIPPLAWAGAALVELAVDSYLAG